MPFVLGLFIFTLIVVGIPVSIGFGFGGRIGVWVYWSGTGMQALLTLIAVTSLVILRPNAGTDHNCGMGAGPQGILWLLLGIICLGWAGFGAGGHASPGKRGHAWLFVLLPIGLFVVGLLPMLAIVLCDPS
jgi:hypothetical protein